MGILSKLINKDAQFTDVLAILATQHEEADALMEKLEKGEGDRRALFTELADKLAAHATVEEKIFYPFIMAKGTNDMLHEAVEEHLAMKRTIADMLTMTLDEDTFKAKLKLLKEQVTHHAHEEEEDKLFPKVKAMLSVEERAGLGNEVIALYATLISGSPSDTVPSETVEAAPLPPVRR